MLTYLKRLSILAWLGILLSACATMTPQQTALNQPLSWETRQQQLVQLTNWKVTGVMGVNTGDQAFSATLQWQQKENNYTILLLGPLGAGAVKLTGQPGLVQLEANNGKHYQATSPEALIADQLGWELPVSNLYYWIRGLPVPNLAYEKHFDAYHHLTDLTQQAWHVQFLRYVSLNNIDVPDKISLENAQLRVKIVIKQWQN